MRVTPCSNYLIAYHTISCHQDTHCTLEVQIHERRVDWMERIGTPKMKVSDSLSCDWLTLGYSPRTAGSKPRNDASNERNGTDADNEDEG